MVSDGPLCLTRRACCRVEHSFAGPKATQINTFEKGLVVNLSNPPRLELSCWEARSREGGRENVIF